MATSETDPCPTDEGARPVPPRRRKNKQLDVNSTDHGETCIFYTDCGLAEVKALTEDCYDIHGPPICQSDDDEIEVYEEVIFMQSISVPASPGSPEAGDSSPILPAAGLSKKRGSNSSHRSSCSSQRSDATSDRNDNSDQLPEHSPQQNKAKQIKKAFSGKLFGKKSKKDKDASDKKDSDNTDKKDNDNTDKKEKDKSDKKNKEKLDKKEKEKLDKKNKEKSGKKEKDKLDKKDKEKLDKKDKETLDKKDKETLDTKVKETLDKKDKETLDKKDKETLEKDREKFNKKEMSDSNSTDSIGRNRLSIDLKSSNIVGRMVKLFSKDPAAEGSSAAYGGSNKPSDTIEEHGGDSDTEADNGAAECQSTRQKDNGSESNTGQVLNVKDADATHVDGNDDAESCAIQTNVKSEVCLTNAAIDIDTKAHVSEFEKSVKVTTIDIKVREPRYSGIFWSQLPQVGENKLLDTVSANDRKLQEAMFEVIKSEEAHLISLNNFITVYLTSEEFGVSDKRVLSVMDHKVVFSNITAIRDTSERFLAELETRMQPSGLIHDVCAIVQEFATEHFNSYIAYCSNQAFQDKKLEELKKNAAFMEAIKQLQNNEACKRLPLVSFLVLPMQRITRLPLLMAAVVKYIDPATRPQQYEAAIKTLGILNNVVAKCNERAKKMQQAEELIMLSQQMVFKDIKPVTVITSSRYLVKKGSLTYIPQGKGFSTFTKKKKQTLYLFLFNDLLLVTKKDGERFLVTDYSERAMLHVETFDEDQTEKTASLPVDGARTKFLPPGIPNYCVHPFLLVILENCKQKRMEYLFDCNTESARSDRERWLDAIRPKVSSDTDETIYEDWDCPQVLCLRRYEAREPDELTLEESDVVRVFRKLEDGMYEGERLRDGQRGWFPQDYTVEINDSHARARNLRMQYKLATSTFNTNL